MKKPLLLLSSVGALALSCFASAQEMPGAIGLNAGQAYALAAAGFVVQSAAASAGYASPGRDSTSGPSSGRAAFHPARRLVPMGLPGVLQPAGGDNAIVAKAREFMANPPYNSNNGTHDWDGWCLGFVYTTMKAATGRNDPQMGQASAKDAYFAMAHAGRIDNNVASIPAGAAVLWGYLGQYGHAAIATGVTAADGSPMIITTSHNGIQEMSIKQFGSGNPTGWGMWTKE